MEKVLDPRKIRIDGSLIVNVRSHTHKTTNPHSPVRSVCKHNLKHFLFNKALLTLLCRDMHLQKHIGNNIVLEAPGIDFLKKMKRINRLNKRSIRKNHLQLVSLQMTQKMPSDIILETP